MKLTVIKPIVIKSIRLKSAVMKLVGAATGFGVMTGVIMPEQYVIAQTNSFPAPNQLECLTGYRDGSYQGDRALSRFEFVAGLGKCLNQQVQQLETAKSGFATKQDVDVLLQNQEELNREIKQLLNRVRMLTDD